jgi:hypothetical protein
MRYGKGLNIFFLVSSCINFIKTKGNYTVRNSNGSFLSTSSQSGPLN